MSISTFLAVDRKSNLVTLFVRPDPVGSPFDQLDLATSQYCDLQGRPAIYLGNDTFQLFDGTLAKRSGGGGSQPT